MQGCIGALRVILRKTYPRLSKRAHTAPMKHIDPDPLDRAIEAMIDAIGRLAQPRIEQGAAEQPQDPPDIPVEKMERYARAISLQVKAIGDIEKHNQQVAAQTQSETYTSYDDLPPPNPEERARVIARVLALAADIDARAEIATDHERAQPE